VSMYGQYIYVDATWQVKTKNRPFFQPWIRIQQSEVKEKIVDPSKGHNCFASIQLYRDATSSRDRKNPGEQTLIDGRYQSHYCGLFFDFDARPGEGEGLSDAIGRAKADASKLSNFFLTKFDDLNPAHVRVWFSGGKGFHVLVQPEVFDIQPHTHLTYMIKNMAWSLAEFLDIPTLDKSVYTISRLWRIPDSVHQSTNLRKIELSVHELHTLTASQILEMAKEPRLDPVWDPVEYKVIAAIPDAVSWWDEWEEYYEWQNTIQLQDPQVHVERPDGEDGLPACMQDLSDNGPKDDGKQRNHVSMVLSTYWKDMGYDEEVCKEFITDWTIKHFGKRGDRELQENIANGISAVRSVYADSKYAFSCASIRSCGNTKGVNPVTCTSPNCKWVPDPETQQPKEIPTVHLSDASRGIYDGCKVRIPIHVSGKQESPYGLPLKGAISCPPNPDFRCAACPFGEDPKATVEMEWTMNASDRELLNMIDVSDNQRIGAVKAKCKFPKDCHKAKVSYADISNMEAIRIIPMVDYATAYQESSNDKDRVVKHSEEHAVREAFYIGHGIQSNRKYNIVAYTFQHPRDQRIVHLFEEATPNQNDIEHFKLNDEMKERLQIFQVGSGQDVAGKMYEIHRDLCHNVHQIGGLNNLAQAVDLTFHSVVGFDFMGKFIEKGWFELLVVGDSSMGKSTMVKRFINHFRVGEMIPGEEAKRSGLVWASIQINGKWTLVWGKIPQNDRRLLVIDEFGEMDPDEVTKMTQLRSEGIAMGQGVSSEYRTWARTRLIFLTNVRGNRDLSSFPYGIQAVASIFKAPADLRRTDLAVTARKGEVSDDIVNKRYKKGEVPHVYTSDLCHNLILWAWSRDPKHVEFVEDSEETIIRLSRQLGERYNSDLYLVESNDMRHKVARVACAVAARLFSTDDRCTKILVTPEHVEYAANLFDRCYGRNNNRSSMKYHQYARRYQDKNDFTARRQKLFTDKLDSYGPNKDTVLQALLEMQDFRKTDLNDQLAMPKGEFEDLWSFLLANNFVSRKGGIYRKSGAFNEFMNALTYNVSTDEIAPYEKAPF